MNGYKKYLHSIIVVPMQAIVENIYRLLSQSATRGSSVSFTQLIHRTGRHPEWHNQAKEFFKTRNWMKHNDVS
jgi:hypothetical protein